jgi:hypothetical protein
MKKKYAHWGTPPKYLETQRKRHGDIKQKDRERERELYIHLLITQF